MQAHSAQYTCSLEHHQSSATDDQQVLTGGSWCLPCRDNYIILQFLFAACTVAAVAPGKSLLQSPSNNNILPLWSGRSIFSVLLLHAGPTEFLYYWGHRALHHNPTLFKDYHAHHHATTVTEATSGTITACVVAP
jgi:sterol desaturase/sphingolipid hydroxylase (fatty acid hydroxylase superfamily)